MLKKLYVFIIGIALFAGTAMAAGFDSASFSSVGGINEIFKRIGTTISPSNSGDELSVDTITATNGNITTLTADNLSITVSLTGGVLVIDTISEKTADNGVDIDGLKIKDSGFVLGSDANGDTYYMTGGTLIRLPIGSVDQVMTVAGGLPTWATVAGGEGISIFDADVCPSGCNYTTVKGAVDAGKVSIFVSGNTTETAVVAITSKTLLHIEKDVVLTMGNNNFTTTQNVWIRGKGEIDYTFTAGKVLFDVSADAIIVDIDGLIIDNNSSVASTDFSDGTIKMNNVEFHLANYVATGIKIGHVTNYGQSIITNTHFIGGGSGTYQSIDVWWADSLRMDNVLFSGTFKTTTSSYVIYFSHSVDSVVNNIYVTSSGIRMWFKNVAVSNFYGNSYVTMYGGSFINSNIVSRELTLYTSSQNRISNVKMGALSIEGSSNVISNIIAGAVTTDASDDDNKLSNCLISSINFSGSDNSVVGCRISGNITIGSGSNRSILTNNDIVGTVNITGDDTTLTACKVGADAGGGANTITVNAAANNTIISGCRTDAAISDSGTNTATGANLIY